MATKVSAQAFADFLQERAAKKDGYLMGTTGQRTATLTKSSYYVNQYKSDSKKYAKALYWLENADRVWDCQGLSEGYYKDITGINVNTYARTNYAQWCDPKGDWPIPNRYKVPGAAVFHYSPSLSRIDHVGFLIKPVVADKPSGDWYIVEAAGVLRGVVVSKLNSGYWHHWGLMTKYFSYPEEVSKPMALGDRNLYKGCNGKDVADLQSRLITLGYSCGRWGADGDFGAATDTALRAFQAAYKLTVDGVYGAKSHAAMLKASDTSVETPQPLYRLTIDSYDRASLDAILTAYGGTITEV